MVDQRLLTNLSLANFLSFGSEPLELDLLPLNVLIGPNASGKSNFIQAIELLRAAPVNIAAPIYAGGGVEEYLYKGSTRSAVAEISADINDPQGQDILRHSLTFTSSSQRLQLLEEKIARAAYGKRKFLARFYYLYLQGIGTAWSQDANGWSPGELTGLVSSLSILSQRNDPERYPALAYLSKQYQAIKLYRSFDLHGINSLRAAQRPDLPTDFLEESGRNLSFVLNDLQFHGVLNEVVDKMKAVYDSITDISVKVQNGTVQTYIREKGLRDPIPATRLSDGTLRYLCLLTILCHPTPPPLICIEEPESGMHPDLIQTLAPLLIDAAQRTQIIATTHSEILVSALSDIPESVIVCEREEQGSNLRRLQTDKLKLWLEKYTLGELWLKGELGGTRW